MGSRDYGLGGQGLGIEGLKVAASVERQRLGFEATACGVKFSNCSHFT